MNQENLLVRQEKGYEIAKTSRIQQTEKGWEVPSQSGKGVYLVNNHNSEEKCNCPDFEFRKCKCKHIFAVEYNMTQEIDKEGNVRVTQTIKQTYSQDWSNYDKASTQQKSLFLNLLSDITNNIQQPEYKFGRPTLPLSDMIYCSIMKVFTTFSLRRFMSDVRLAKEKNYIDTNPCYASVGHFMQKEELTPILVDIITLTSLPLRTVEKDFAIDSTGFGSSKFDRWHSFKYGRNIKSKKWIKCHFMCGVKSNIVTSVKLTTQYKSDSPQLKELIKKTAEHFDMEEVSCDKAYSSRENLNIISQLGAIPLIPFKKNVTGRSKGSITWKKMYHYFQLHNDKFMEQYHKRSNVESTVFMIKSKFGDSVKSKTWTAQINEVLCKIICHNICCVIQEMFELGVETKFH